MKGFLIKNATIVNEGRSFVADLLLRNSIIEKIGTGLSSADATVVEAGGKHLFPGVIDDQVHFREPGLTHKGDIHSESRAAVAGGVTSFMDMPNTIPPACSLSLLEQKYSIAADRSLANYSFYLGASNENLDEIKKADASVLCGLKIFMGSSTGNMLVDDQKVLETIFKNTDLLIATHCEDEATVRANAEKYRIEFGDKATSRLHPLIRTTEACYLSSSRAVALAESTGARLHILHLSSGKEVGLFRNDIPLAEKKITSEVCVHHLWFSDADYERKGNFIKWNPSIKTVNDRDALWKGLLNNHLDIIATDHAPHTIEEKEQPYFKAPSGGPLIQHTLIAMLECYRNKKIDLETIVEKMCHAPAVCFRIEKRGFIREGYFADIVIADLNQPQYIETGMLLSKCGWSPFEGETFHSSVTHTFVNGALAYSNGIIHDEVHGKRLTFKR